MSNPRSNPRRAIHRLANVPTFSPKLLPGLKLWLSAGALNLSDGAPVASWPDLSGRGNTVTSPVVPPPKFQANAVNGSPAVALDGSTHYFQFPNGDFQNMGSFGVYCVLSNTGPGQYNPRIFLNGTVSSSVSAFQFSGTQEIGMYFAADWAHGLVTASAPLTARFGLIGLGYNGTAMSTTKNGATTAGPSPVLVPPPAPNGSLGFIGGDASGSRYAGSIAELLVFLPALAPDADQKLTRYLMTRYALA